MVNQQTPQRLFLLRGLFYKVLNKKPSVRGMSRNREGGPFNDICSHSKGIVYISTPSLVTLKIKTPDGKWRGKPSGVLTGVIMSRVYNIIL